jgi:hypothetical protein
MDEILEHVETIETPARTKVIVVDEGAHAIIEDSRQKIILSCKRGPQGAKGKATGVPIIKNGVVHAPDFSGSPQRAPVIFETPFPPVLYTVRLTGADSRIFTAESLTLLGFTINANAALPLTGDVFWEAEEQGEFS